MKTPPARWIAPLAATAAFALVLAPVAAHAVEEGIPETAAIETAAPGAPVAEQRAEDVGLVEVPEEPASVSAVPPAPAGNLIEPNVYPTDEPSPGPIEQPAEDVTAPVVSTPGWKETAAGWSSQSSIRFEATDDSGVVDTLWVRVDGSLTGLSSAFMDVPLAQGTHTFEYWATDHAGNRSETQDKTVRVDLAKPVVFGPALTIEPLRVGDTASAQRAGAATDYVFEQGEEVYVYYSCEDEQSGLEYCHGARRSGETIDTSTVGDGFAIWVAAQDNAGNQTITSVTYAVEAAAAGPTEPTDPTDPTEPTEPIEPGEPTVPAPPVEPSAPVIPATPTTPVAATSGAPVAAANTARSTLAATGTGDVLGALAGAALFLVAGAGAFLLGRRESTRDEK